MSRQAHPPAAPPVRGEARRTADGIARPAVPGIVLAIVAVLSAVNLAAAVFVARAVQDMRLIEAKLEDLADFDLRLRARLSQMDNAVQLRFDEQSHEMRNRLDAIQREIETSVAALAIPRQSPAPEPAAPAASAKIIPPLAESPGDAAAQGKMTYQRVESADGKVLYRRLDSD